MQLKEERDGMLRLKGDNGILRKKLKSLTSELDDQKRIKDDMEVPHAHMLTSIIQACISTPDSNIIIVLSHH